MSDKIGKAAPASRGSWARVPRKLLGTVLRFGPWVTTLYFWMFLRARWSAGHVVTRTGKRVYLMTGQTIVGAEQVEHELSTPQLRFHRARYRAAIDTLVTAGEILVDPTRQGTIVTIARLADPELLPEDEQDEGNRQDDRESDRQEHRSDTANITGEVTTRRRRGRRSDTKKEPKTGSKKETKNHGVCADAHPPTTHRGSFFDRVATAWQGATGHSLHVTTSRRKQVLRMKATYGADLLKAVEKYGKIRSVPDPYPTRRTWTFDTFFTPRVVDLVLQHDLSYFQKRRLQHRASSLERVPGRTPAAAYDGAVRKESAQGHEEDEEGEVKEDDPELEDYNG